MKRRKAPKLRRKLLHKYVIVGLKTQPSHTEVKSLLARITAR